MDEKWWCATCQCYVEVLKIDVVTGKTKFYCITCESLIHIENKGLPFSPELIQAMVDMKEIDRRWGEIIAQEEKRQARRFDQEMMELYYEYIDKD